MKFTWRGVFVWTLLCAFGGGVAETRSNRVHESGSSAKPAQPSTEPQTDLGSGSAAPGGHESGSSATPAQPSTEPQTDLGSGSAAPGGSERPSKPGQGSRTKELWRKLLTLAPKITSRIELVALRAVPEDGIVGKHNDSRTFAVGEDVVFGLRVEKPCHLLLLNFGTSKAISVLIPSAFHQSTMLSPTDRRWVFKPNRLLTESYRFPVAGPPGTEFVKAFCTQEQLNLSMLGDMPEKGFLTIKPGQNNVGLERLIGALERMEWAEASVPIVIVETK